MDSISERLQYLLDKKGLTVYEFCKKTGFKQATFSKILSNNSKPSLNNMQLILNYFGVDQYWLINGDIKPPDKPPELKEDPEPYNVNKVLSQSEILSMLALSYKELVRQHGELIKLLSKDSDTLNRNAISIEKLTSTIDCKEHKSNKNKGESVTTKNV